MRLTCALAFLMRHPFGDPLGTYILSHQLSPFLITVVAFYATIRAKKIFPASSQVNFKALAIAYITLV